MVMHLLGFQLLALYVGPDQLLPLASILGAIGGALMIFWRQVAAFARRVVGAFGKHKS